MIQHQPGTKMANGSIVIAQRKDIVLCVLPHNEMHPYATWRLEADGQGTAGGDYCRTLEDGMLSLKQRAG